jgi:pilus assembly protein Flp/PilA
MLTYVSVWTQIKSDSLLGRMRNLRGDRKGVTAMEYGIIAAVTVAAVGASIVAIGGSLTTIWTSVKTTMATAAG